MNTHTNRIGYARVSTTDQNLDSQLAALEANGCTVIRSEKRSGNSMDDREELRTILAFMRQGDTLVVTRIDRLARSLKDLQIIADQLQTTGVHLVTLEQPVDTSTVTGKMFFNLLGVFAEFETSLRRERQLEGIAQAKKRGIYKGRPVTVDYDNIRTMLADGHTPSHISRVLNVSRGTVYKAKNG